MTEPAWARRFRAVEHDVPTWSSQDPDLLTLVTNRSGSRQVWTYRLGDGAWTRLSDEPIGVDGQAMVLPDGRSAWRSDATGDERGALVSAEPGSPPHAVLPELPEGWPMGIAFVGSRAVLTIEVDGTYTTYVIDADSSPRVLWATPFASGVGRMYPYGGGLSADGTLACICHAGGGDILHNALRVFDADSGQVL